MYLRFLKEIVLQVDLPYQIVWDMTLIPHTISLSFSLILFLGSLVPYRWKLSFNVLVCIYAMMIIQFLFLLNMGIFIVPDQWRVQLLLWCLYKPWKVVFLFFAQLTTSIHFSLFPFGFLPVFRCHRWITSFSLKQFPFT